jgi:hypothetical protein
LAGFEDFFSAVLMSETRIRAAGESGRRRAPARYMPFLKLSQTSPSRAVWTLL